MQSWHFWHFLLNTFLKKKLQILWWKNNENREEVAWSFTPQEDHIKASVCLVLYKWAVHATVCVPPPYIYIYIYTSYIKCNVVTLPKRILTCFIIYMNEISTFLTLFVKYDFEKKLYVLYCMCASPLIYIYIYHA